MSVKSHNQFVIYSAVVGNYDDIKQPLAVDARFDYILFSNDIKEPNIGVWQVRPIPYTNPDNTRICRYVKTHPEEFVPEYKASVWMDSNIRIAKSTVYDHIIELYEQGTLVASMQHPDRNCIYDEMVMVVAIPFEEEDIVLQWGKKLRKEHYPKNNGLFETNVFYRRHTELVARMDIFWWQCIEEYSKRDQLSCNYVLWKLHIPAAFFLPQNQCVRNSYEFCYYEHAHENGKRKMANINGTYLLHQANIAFCRRDEATMQVIGRLYYNVYILYFPSMVANVLGMYLGSKLWIIRQYGRVKRFIQRKIINSKVNY